RPHHTAQTSTCPAKRACSRPGLPGVGARLPNPADLRRMNKKKILSGDRPGRGRLKAELRPGVLASHPRIIGTLCPARQLCVSSGFYPSPIGCPEIPALFEGLTDSYHDSVFSWPPSIS